MASASCIEETELFAHVQSCVLEVQHNITNGALATCAQVDTCVMGHQAGTAPYTQWTGLPTITSDGAGNFSIGSAGVNGTSENEVTCNAGTTTTGPVT